MWLFGKGSKSRNEEAAGSRSDWKILDREEQMEEVRKLSQKLPVVIFKHSTRCSTSMLAKLRLESGWKFSPDKAVFYYLDLLRYRPVSGKVAEIFGVEHQSPQLLVISKGVCVAHASHLEVSAGIVKPFLDF